MQKLGLSLTFKREGLTLKELIRDTYGDTLDVVFFKGCWSLTNQIEHLIRDKYNFYSEQGYYEVSGADFLVDLYLLLKNERAKATEAIEHSGIPNYTDICALPSLESYRLLLETNMRDLEWLIFWNDKRIATSQLFEKLSDECFFESPRKTWIEMCKAWGNKSEDLFSIILWID